MGFLSFNSNKPGGEINRKNNLKITKNFLKLIKFIRNIQKIFSWKESVAMCDIYLCFNKFNCIPVASFGQNFWVCKTKKPSRASFLWKKALKLIL